MSEKKEIIINCGISQVSAGIFSKQGDSILLEQVGLETLRYNYSSEEQWLDCFSEGLKKLCAREKIKGNARFIFPGCLLLTKTIRVPHVEEEKQKKIVAFELMQKMPVPLTELIWDYQVIDDDGVEQEILAFAVKPKVAEDFCEKVMEIGLNPVQITPAPVLDYNALRASGIGLDSGETLVVNIGARSTNLLFINPTGFLLRPLSIGGNSLTQNISDNLGTQFEKAEEIKKNYFSGEVAFSADDPSVQLLENCSKQFLARLSQEITRSLVTYKRLKKGKSPSRMYLAGRGALLNQLPEYLSQSQRLDIDYFDPLQALVLSDSVSQEMRNLLPFMLSEPVGLASSIFSADGSEQSALTKTINLLPESKLTNLNFKKKQPLLLVSAFLLSLTPLPALLTNYQESESLSAELEDAKDIRGPLIGFHEGMESKSNTLDFLQYFTKEMHSRNQIYQQQGKTLWKLRVLLNHLQNSLEYEDISDTWFDEFKITGRNQDGQKNPSRSTQDSTPVLKLSGRYLVRPTVESNSDKAALRENLIELNQKKQRALTSHLKELPIIAELRSDVFKTSGKGDLENKYFTYFEFEIILN
ncbi:MAG: pilus assembly protein PilM [Opitutae bacterium]|nr:pilus assembly protein PilM [Opitutae bacterium]